MKKNKNVILMGLGVDDPKGIFGTTLDLNKKFPNRVYDLPTAENGFTGFAIGLALSGKKPIITHQRVEFSLLSIDQLFNQAAKWNYMTAGERSVPMVIRLIIEKDAKAPFTKFRVSFFTYTWIKSCVSIKSL